MSEQNLTGKVALITGGNAGIGRAAAIGLATRGAAIVLGARREQEGEAVAEEIRGLGGQATFVQADVTRQDDVARLVAAARSNYGGLDIAFNNAGTEGSGVAPLSEESEANARSIMEVNYFGLWYAMKAEIPLLVERGGGSIINTTSVAGVRGFPGLSSYAASKFAVEGLSRSAAYELSAVGVRVNTVAPGPVDTDMLERTTGGDASALTSMVPLQRAGTTDEVAAAVVFLASPEASYITGLTLRVDGGMVA